MKVTIIQPGRQHTVKQIKKDVKQRQCCGCMNNPYGHFISNFMAIGGLIGVIICSTNLYSNNRDLFGDRIVDANYLGGLIASCLVLGVIWIMRQIMSCLSPTAKSLKGKTGTTALIPFIEQIRHAEPQMFVSSESYHYETRTTTHTSTDSHGNTTYSTSTHTEKVTTHRERIQLQISSWADESPPLESHITRTFLSVYFTKQLLLDDQSNDIKQFVINDLTLRNKGKDTHFNIHENVEIEGYKDDKLFSFETGTSFFNPFWYAMSNLFLWFFIFEVMYESHMCVSQYDIIKRGVVSGHVQVTFGKKPEPVTTDQPVYVVVQPQQPVPIGGYPIQQPQPYYGPPQPQQPYYNAPPMYYQQPQQQPNPQNYQESIYHYPLGPPTSQSHSIEIDVQSSADRVPQVVVHDDKPSNDDHVNLDKVDH